ncbi:MAG: polysaccharide deacetylase family protein [Mucilaginibacter sp.]
MSLLQKIYAKAARSVIYFSQDLQRGLGFGKSIYRSARGSRIMVYHGVCKNNPLKFNTLFITQKTFEAHLKFYRKHFNVVSLDEYYAQKFSRDKFNICLTFDDGFANNHKYVLPLLQEYQMPATFFITAIRGAGYDILWNDFISIFSKYGPDKITVGNEAYIKNHHNKYVSAATSVGLIEKLHGCGFDEKVQVMKNLYPLASFKTKEIDNDYWQQMSVEQIAELAASPFVTIGAHSVYHNDLTRINIDEASAELTKTKQFLEDVTKKDVHCFAFPYGSYNSEVIVAAKRAGHTQLLAVEFTNPADEKDVTIRERFTINPFISVTNQIRAILKGHYE